MRRHRVRADYEELSSASDNADNISTKSRFIHQPFHECPGLQGQLPDHRHALTGIQRARYSSSSGS
jgi:hypothetical protein